MTVEDREMTEVRVLGERETTVVLGQRGEGISGGELKLWERTTGG